jgi:hypothetical protein
VAQHVGTSPRSIRARIAYAEALHPFRYNAAWAVVAAVVLTFLVGAVFAIVFAMVVLAGRWFAWGEGGFLRRRFVRKYAPLPQWSEFRAGRPDPDDRFLG